MRASPHAKILAGRPAVDFIGRGEATERLVAHARSSNAGLLLLSTPGAGATELLKQTYDRLFRQQQEVIPFYFSVRPTMKSGRDVAALFLEEFIRHLVAFRRKDPSIFRSPGGLDELAELSLNVGGFWIDRLIDTARTAWVSPDGGPSFIRNCLAAPVRAAANDARSVVMLDHVHNLPDIDGGDTFFDELKEIFDDAGVPFVLSGHRRFLHGQIDCERMELDYLGIQDAARVVEVFAEESRVEITDEARDLVAVQLGGNASLMRHLVRTASDNAVALTSFYAVEKAYADALFGGRIGREFDASFASACRSAELERRVVSMLFDGQVSESERVERERWYRRLQLSEADAESLLNRLNYRELIRLTPIHVETMSENLALTDHIATRFRLTIASESRASVFSESLAEFIKRAPEMMARSYIVRSSLGVRELLGTFDGQQVPSGLIDYGEFVDELKGLPDEEILDRARQAPPITLPRIFFTTAASAFYRPIAQIAESERSAIALGFEPGTETGEEIVWIAAEVDSKLEASRELAEFWCDRLEAAALMCDFVRFRIWLIAPEGFTSDALEVLKTRNAYGSGRRQVGLLGRFLNAPPSDSVPLAENEYEMVIPMNGESELIAAHAVEEIAKRHHLDARSINQLKTALVEACINAAEHSLSPDRKIYQRFRVEEDRVVLTVSNRGLRLTSRMPADEPTEGRRGWGLKLMRRLMDEVTIEHVDDGTRIVMTKFLRAAA
jgi:serine/threonine-protein kinase RsbW